MVHWEAYFAHDPFGEQRQDMRFAMLACAVAQVAGNRNARMDNFLLYPEQRYVQQSTGQILASAKLLAGWFIGNRHR